MKPAGASVLLLALTVKICRSGIIIQHSKSNETSCLVDAVVNILECYYENRGKAVGLSGHVPDILFHSLSKKLIPVTSLDDSEKTEFYDGVWRRSDLYRLDVFIVTGTTMKQVQKLFRVIKNSKWWNQMAHYLIVNWSSATDKECADSAKYLHQAWTRNMINAKVICWNRTRAVMLYSYNPYTTEPPISWQLDRIYKGENAHPFAVFSRDYRNGDEICDTGRFDVTKNLGGHNFYILQRRGDVVTVDMAKSRKLELLTADNINEMLVSTLNATPVFEFTEDPLFYYPQTKKHMCKKPMAIDIDCRPPSNVHDRVATMSYPIGRVELLVMTQFKGHLTQLEKIVSVTDVSSRIGLCLVLLLTLLFFKYFSRNSFMTSWLNVMRIVCNIGFANLSNDLSQRLYVGTVLLFAVVMQGIYQGNLATLLTQQVPIRDVVTKQDLADFGYTIYVQNYLAKYVDEPMFDGRVREMEGSECDKYVLANASAACIFWASLIKDEAWDLKTHLAREPVATLEQAYLLPADTHLEDRINKILQTILEADIIVPLHLKGQDRTLSDYQFDEEVKRNQIAKVITLGELEFAFVILGIGLACATITFIVELAVHRYRSQIRTSCTNFVT